jgi:hypothetical protein
LISHSLLFKHLAIIAPSIWVGCVLVAYCGEGWKVGRLEGWKVGRLEGWKVGRLEGWKVGRLEGDRHINVAEPTD